MSGGGKGRLGFGVECRNRGADQEEELVGRLEDHSIRMKIVNS